MMKERKEKEEEMNGVKDVWERSDVQRKKRKGRWCVAAAAAASRTTQKEVFVSRGSCHHGLPLRPDTDVPWPLLSLRR